MERAGEGLLILAGGEQLSVIFFDMANKYFRIIK
jgi:hypothetical protein